MSFSPLWDSGALLSKRPGPTCASETNPLLLPCVRADTCSEHQTPFSEYVAGHPLLRWMIWTSNNAHSNFNEAGIAYPSAVHLTFANQTPPWAVSAGAPAHCSALPSHCTQGVGHQQSGRLRFGLLSDTYPGVVQPSRRLIRKADPCS